jgi:hypothetical protein
MKKYHDNEVNLSRDDQKEMRGRRDNGRTRLKSGLEQDGYQKPTEFASQGSYAMRTMVQDPQCDYDIDDGAYFEKDDLVDKNGKELTPREARERVCRALRQDDRVSPAQVRDRCVRQVYAAGYHIDIPVYRITRSKDAAGADVFTYELASGDEWVRSDARNVTKWFNDIIKQDLEEGQADTSQLRRVVRYTKKFARSRMAWKKKTTSGIALTRLVVDCFIGRDGRDDEAVYETWKAISKRLQNTTRVEHPISGLLADANDAEVRFFADCLDEALETLEVIETECEHEAALKAWDKAFSTSYFSDQLNKKGAAATAPVFVTSREKAERDDGGRRFG